MKRVLYLIAILFLVVFLTGCGKKSLIGKWEYRTGGFYYIFNEDGTGSYGVPGAMEDFTYNADGNKISMTYVGESDTFTVTYKIKKNQLTITDSNENYVYIKK